MPRSPSPPDPAPRANLLWRRQWLADPDLPDRGKLLAAVLAEHGDWDTGENVHPQQSTMAAALGWTERKVRRALADLLAAGALEPTGHLRYGVVIYRRVMLASPDTGDRTTPDTGDRTNAPSPDTGDRTTEGQSGHFGSPVRTLWVASPDTGDLHISSISPTMREERGGGGDAGPAPDGRDAPRPTPADVAAILTANAEHFPPAWAGVTPDPNHQRLADELGAWMAAGWAEHLPAALATLGKPKGSPSGLIAAHLDKLRATGTPPVAPVTIPANDTAPPAGGAKGKQKPTRPHPFATADPRHLETFLRATSAGRQPLHDAIATMLADGLDVTLDLAGGDCTLDVSDPGRANPDEPGWLVQWAHTPGEEPTLTGDLTEYDDNILAELCWRISETGDPNGMPGDGTGARTFAATFEPGRLSITPRMANVNHFAQLVAVTRKANTIAARWTADRLERTGT